MKLKQEIGLALFGGITTAAIGLSTIATSAYFVGKAPETGAWNLVNYFQAVFGIAGIFLGLIMALTGLILASALPEILEKGDSS